MVKLVSKSPVDGIVPLEINGLSLTEIVPEQVTSVAPYAGQESAASEALTALIGAGIPAPNRSTGREGARVVWTGAGQAMVIGPVVDPSLAQHAALTDQSDAWVVLEVSGPDCRLALERICPIDLHPDAFAVNAVARTVMEHMSAIIWRKGENEFRLCSARSSAGSFVHAVENSIAWTH